MQVGGFPPYPISYRSIVPKAAECTNLLVPVCLSASHIAYGSIRMEPVFMVLGQSAATAAVLALDGNVAVQDVDYAKLKEKLLRDGQILDWTGPRREGGIDARKLAGIVVDDARPSARASSRRAARSRPSSATAIATTATRPRPAVGPVHARLAEDRQVRGPPVLFPRLESRPTCR